MSSMPGGISQGKVPSEEEHAILAQVKSEVETKVGKTYAIFQAISFATQVVAGTVYVMKVQCDDDILHVKIFKPLPHTNNPPSVMNVATGQSDEAPLTL